MRIRGICEVFLSPLVNTQDLLGMMFSCLFPTLLSDCFLCHWSLITHPQVFVVLQWLVTFRCCFKLRFNVVILKQRQLSRQRLSTHIQSAGFVAAAVGHSVSGKVVRTRVWHGCPRILCPLQQDAVFCSQQVENIRCWFAINRVYYWFHFIIILLPCCVVWNKWYLVWICFFPYYTQCRKYNTYWGRHWE